MKRWWCKISIQIYILLISMSCVHDVQAQSDDLKANVEAERIIVQLVSEGKVADLSIFFPNETERVIRAEFFEDLLTEKVITLPKQGVFIKNVTIEGPIALKDEDFENVNITECVFTSMVNFQGANFKNVSFSFCRFLKEAMFQKVTVYDSAQFDNATFYGLADFSFINVVGSIDLNHSHFEHPETTNFNGMNIGNSAFVNQVTFEGPTNFGYARINQIINFDETQFNSPKESSFNSVSVGNSAFFRDVIFLGSADFGHASIGANIDFSRAKFNSKNRLRFNTMQVSGSILFQNSFFAGPVFFLYSEIGGLGDFSHSQFPSEFLADFSFLNIEHGISFEGVMFGGPVSFAYVDTSGPLNFNNAKFTNSNASIVFTNVNVGGDFIFSNASLAGVLIIRNTNVTNGFGAENIEFLNSNESIIMSQVDAQSLGLDVIAATGRMSFTNCSFVDYSLIGPKEIINFLSLDLSGTNILRSLSIKNFNVKDFIGSNLLSYGNATIENIDIDESANLSFAHFNNLLLLNVSWPSNAGELDLDGFVYHEIIPGKSLDDSNWRKLLDLINRSNYDVALYRNLESYFGDQGHSDWSDQVFVAQKRRERSDLLKWYSLKWWWSFFLDGLILYGRQPSRSFLWSTCIIIIGTYVFKKEKMSPLVKGNKEYNAFWYSVDLFIPGIDLGVSSKWSPRARDTLIYKRMHQTLGWLVIPVTILAITGFFR